MNPKSTEEMFRALEMAGCDLRDLRASLELEYGRVVSGLVPHNPAQVPLLQLLEPEADQVTVFDVEAGLGKVCTRGHLANVGAGEIELAFQGLAGDQWSGGYVLPAGAALDTSSFAYRKVRMLSAGGAGRVQLLAQ